MTPDAVTNRHASTSHDHLASSSSRCISLAIEFMLSAVIPVYNEAESLEQLYAELAAVAGQRAIRPGNRLRRRRLDATIPGSGSLAGRWRSARAGHPVSPQFRQGGGTAAGFQAAQRRAR